MTKHRPFILWLAFISLISYLSFSLVQIDLPAIVKKVKPAVVLIYIYDSKDKLLAKGSGFFVNTKGEVITNIHVLVGAHRGKVKTSQGKTYFIKGVIAEDIEGDLVKIVLETSEKSFPYLQVSSSLPEEGERVLVIGYPLGLDQTVSDGIVSGVVDTLPFGKTIQITAPISPGSSGSPVVNMAEKVIGVVTLQFGEVQSLISTIPSERIVNLIPIEKQPLPEWTIRIENKWLESASGLFFSGLNLFWEEDYIGALPYFEEAVKKYPNFAEAHINLGLVYGKLGYYKDAIEALNQAINFQPDIAGAHCSLGLVYGKFGRFNKAIEAFRQAIRLQPSYARAHLGIGLSYLALGDKSSALEEYEILKTLDPDLAKELLNWIYK